MKAPIGDTGYYLSCDASQWLLLKQNVAASGKSKGVTTYPVVGYFPTSVAALSSAADRIIREKLMSMDDCDTLRTWVDILRREQAAFLALIGNDTFLSNLAELPRNIGPEGLEDVNIDESLLTEEESKDEDEYDF